MAKLHDTPSRIFLVGMMGSGKTTVGKLLAEKLDLPFADLDVLIEERTHHTINELFAQFGEFDFRACEAHMLRDIPRRFPEGIIATGGGTPLQFENMDFMNKNGLTIFLNIDAEHLITRLSDKRTERPLLNRDDWESYLDQLLHERQACYQAADVTVEVTGGESANAVKNILAALPQITGH